MTSVELHDFSWDRMIAAVDAVRERAYRAAAALRAAGIGYVIVGGHAVSAWVARIDAEAVRNTKDVDLLIRRGDLPAASAALTAAGFVYQNVNGMDLFLDGPRGSVRSAVHIVFAGEKVRPDYPLPAPQLHECEAGPEFPVPTLDALVRMKLTSFRPQDQVHLLDLLEVGLVDESWCARFPLALSARLKALVDSRRGP